MNLVDELHSVVAALHGAGIRYAICGGVAVTLHGVTRSTKDIDILVAAADLSRALDVVRPLGYAFLAIPKAFDAGTPRERQIQRVSKVVGQEHLLLDFLLEAASLDGALADRLQLTLAEGPLAVVSRATLIRMKRLAGRAQDLADVERLEGVDGG